MIDHILSFLDTKLVVQASVLSKRWKCTWKQVYILRFHSPSFHSYSNFKRTQLSMKNLVSRLRIPYHHKFNQFIISRNVDPKIRPEIATKQGEQIGQNRVGRPVEMELCDRVFPKGSTPARNEGGSAEDFRSRSVAIRMLWRISLERLVTPMSGGGGALNFPLPQDPSVNSRASRPLVGGHKKQFSRRSLLKAGKSFASSPRRFPKSESSKFSTEPHRAIIPGGNGLNGPFNPISSRNVGENPFQEIKHMRGQQVVGGQGEQEEILVGVFTVAAANRQEIVHEFAEAVPFLVVVWNTEMELCDAGFPKRTPALRDDRGCSGGLHVQIADDQDTAEEFIGEAVDQVDSFAVQCCGSLHFLLLLLTGIW
ncbi:hypothetical protein LINGRAHAP2_LOCUS9863 [Linum grandiflorum]